MSLSSNRVPMLLEGLDGFVCPYRSDNLGDLVGELLEAAEHRGGAEEMGKSRCKEERRQHTCTYSGCG